MRVREYSTRETRFAYDERQDALLFTLKDKDYKLSFEFQNFVIDIDEENFVTGIRIFDASKVSGVSKMALRNLIHGEFKADVKDNVVTVRFKFVGKTRNRFIPLFHERQPFTQQFTTPINSKYHLQDSKVTVPEIVA